MNEMNAAPLFPQPVVFPDVDPAVLAREDEPVAVGQELEGSGAWQLYLTRTLSPLREKRAVATAS